MRVGHLFSVEKNKTLRECFCVYEGNIVMLVLVIDIETTGLSRSKDSITVIGTIVYDSENDCTITEKCFNVVLAEKNPNGKDALAMKTAICRLLDEADVIVAFNGVGFDMPFIRKWLATDNSILQLPSPVDTCNHPKIEDDNLEQYTKANARVIQTQCNVSAESRSIVTAPATDRWAPKYLDFCLLSRKYTNRFISLHNVCLHNKIKAVKSASGLQAIVWAQQENWTDLEEYCMQDVVVLLALTKHAITNGITLPVMAYRKKSKTDDILMRLDEKMQPYIVDPKNKSHQPRPPIKTRSCGIFHCDDLALDLS